MNAAFQLYGSQRAYDDAEPADPLEIDLDDMKDDLMWQDDTDLISFDGWARGGADELLTDLIGKHPDPALMVRLVLMAYHSKDSALGDLVEPFIRPLEDHALATLDTSLRKELRA